MDGAGVDVIVYPTWSNVARLVGDYITPDGGPQMHPSCMYCEQHTPWAPVMRIVSQIQAYGRCCAWLTCSKGLHTVQQVSCFRTQAWSD